MMYVVTISQWNNLFFCCLILVEASCHHHHDIHIYLLSDHLLLMANEILTNYITFSCFRGLKSSWREENISFFLSMMQALRQVFVLRQMVDGKHT